MSATDAPQLMQNFLDTQPASSASKGYATFAYVCAKPTDVARAEALERSTTRATGKPDMLGATEAARRERLCVGNAARKWGLKGMCGVWSALRMIMRKTDEEEIREMMTVKKEIVMKRGELKSGWIASLDDSGGAWFCATSWKNIKDLRQDSHDTLHLTKRRIRGGSKLHSMAIGFVFLFSFG